MYLIVGEEPEGHRLDLLGCHLLPRQLAHGGLSYSLVALAISRGGLAEHSYLQHAMVIGIDYAPRSQELLQLDFFTS